MAIRPRNDRTGRRRNRRYLFLALLVLGLAAGWSALWAYTSSKTENAITAWRAREAKAGRIYSCGRQTVGGFPFRIEVVCDGAAAEFRGGRAPIALRTSNIHVAAQVYQPNLLIAEYTGPLTIGEPGQPAAMTSNWSLAQSSIRGTPTAPERVSIALDMPSLRRNSPAEVIFKAKRIEFHGRLAEGSVEARPVIEVGLHLENLVAPTAGPLAVVPINVEMTARLRGLKDFSPKPWAARFREIQAAGGKIDIAQLRVEQGQTLAIGSGTLNINAQGRVEGQVNLTVAGLEAFINAVGAAAQQRTGFGITLGLGLLGGNKQLEGRPAIALPLRVNNGDVLLGPIKLGQIPPLF
jgi:hypothetical protein